MRVGATVLVNIPPGSDGLVRSTFHGRLGVVAAVDPTMVRFPEDERALFFGDEALVPASDPVHWTAGE